MNSIHCLPTGKGRGILTILRLFFLTTTDLIKDNEREEQAPPLPLPFIRHCMEGRYTPAFLQGKREADSLPYK